MFLYSTKISSPKHVQNQTHCLFSQLYLVLVSIQRRHYARCDDSFGTRLLGYLDQFPPRLNKHHAYDLFERVTH